MFILNNKIGGGILFLLQLVGGGKSFVRLKRSLRLHIITISGLMVPVLIV